VIQKNHDTLLENVVGDWLQIQQLPPDIVSMVVRSIVGLVLGLRRDVVVAVRTIVELLGTIHAALEDLNLFCENLL
jgi:hypothetical protein